MRSVAEDRTARHRTFADTFSLPMSGHTVRSHAMCLRNKQGAIFFGPVLVPDAD